MRDRKINSDETNNPHREAAVLKKVIYRLGGRSTKAASKWSRPSFSNQIIIGIDFILKAEPAKAYDFERYMEIPNFAQKAFKSIRDHGISNKIIHQVGFY